MGSGWALKDSQGRYWEGNSWTRASLRAELYGSKSEAESINRRDGLKAKPVYMDGGEELSQQVMFSYYGKTPTGGVIFKVLHDAYPGTKVKFTGGEYAGMTGEIQSLVPLRYRNSPRTYRIQIDGFPKPGGWNGLVVVDENHPYLEKR